MTDDEIRNALYPPPPPAPSYLRTTRTSNDSATRLGFEVGRNEQDVPLGKGGAWCTFHLPSPAIIGAASATVPRRRPLLHSSTPSGTSYSRRNCSATAVALQHVLMNCGWGAATTCLRGSPVARVAAAPLTVAYSPAGRYPRRPSWTTSSTRQASQTLSSRITSRKPVWDNYRTVARQCAPAQIGPKGSGAAYTQEY